MKHKLSIVLLLGGPQQDYSMNSFDTLMRYEHDLCYNLHYSPSAKLLIVLLKFPSFPKVRYFAFDHFRRKAKHFQVLDSPPTKFYCTHAASLRPIIKYLLITGAALH